MIYVSGSLKHKRAREIANLLRADGHKVFDDWHACGPEADAEWRIYEQSRGRSFREALRGEFSRYAFAFDRHHLCLCSAFVLVLPAGKSSHMELMYCQGQGKRGIIYMDKEPETDWDLMYSFADRIVVGESELLSELVTFKGVWG